MSDSRSVKVQVSAPFLRRLKDLAKRYRQIQRDIQPILDALEVGDFWGDQVAGTGYTVLKVRAKNSDIPIGKSGGYRLIYSGGFARVDFATADLRKIRSSRCDG